jgi:hypothetical protein
MEIVGSTLALVNQFATTVRSHVDLLRESEQSFSQSLVPAALPSYSGTNHNKGVSQEEAHGVHHCVRIDQ